MADFGSISAAITSLKTASDLAKLIKESKLSLKDAEIKLKLAELIGALADTKIELAEIQALLQSKQKEIDELKTQLDLKREVTWDPPSYWIGPKKNGDGPYCQNCYDDKSKLIRLQGNGNGYWNCKSCDSDFTDSTYKPEGPKIIERKNSWDNFF